MIHGLVMETQAVSKPTSSLKGLGIPDRVVILQHLGESRL